MRARLTPAFLVILLAWTVPGLATTVTFNFTYAGLPVSNTFSDMRSGMIKVIPPGGSQFFKSFTAADSYQLPVDLAAGDYRFEIVLSPREEMTDMLHYSGDLFSTTGTVHVPDQPSFTVDAAFQYSIRFTSPVDSASSLDGACQQCPNGPAVPETFTLSWNAVPRAVRYEVVIQRLSCSASLTSEIVKAGSTSVEIHQGQAPGEKYISLTVWAYDDGDNDLATQPYIRYQKDGCTSNGLYLHQGQSSRAAHSAGSIISQVAHASGFGGTFWTSQLVLTNPTGSDVTTKLYYTPRDADGLTSYQEAEVTVPSGSCRTLDDVVGQQFGASGAGALEVHSSLLVVSSRTSTPAQGGGSYGQGVVPIAASQVLSAAGHTALAGGVVKSGAARSNLALNEVWGEQATVTVTLTDRDGTVLGSREVMLAPYSSHQINDLASTLGSLSSLSEGQVKVTFKNGTGRVAATLFVVDASGDPATIPLERLSRS